MNTIPENTAELISKLIEKTKERKLSWMPSSRDTEYMLQFSASVVTIDSWTDNVSKTDIVDFAIFNKDGGQIERIAFSKLEEGYETLLAFYNLVKKSFLKTDETYQSLKDELDKL
jgi:hypothetical protein